MDRDFSLPDLDGISIGLIIVFVLAFLLVLSVWVIWLISSFALFSSILPSATRFEIGSLTASLVTGLVNLFLTAGLIYIYVNQTKVISDQRDIANDQTGILDRQKRIMEAEFIPVVEIHVKEINDDEVTIHCSNEGTGLAKKFSIDLSVYAGHQAIEEAQGQFREVGVDKLSNKSFLSTSEVPGYGQMEQAAHYTGAVSTPHRIRDSDPLASVRTEEILREQEDTDLKFTISFERFVDPGGDPSAPDTISFEQGLTELSDHGVEVVGLSMSISYENIFDEIESEKHLITSWINTQEDEPLKTLFSKSKDRTIYKKGKYSSEDEPYLAGYTPPIW